MIRLTLLTGFCLFLAIYAWKDWYKALCGVIALMAVVEHPDMPKSLLGVQGLNAWNLVLLIVVLAFFSRRAEEGLRWDMPRYVTALLLLYFTVVMVSFVRLVIGRDELEYFGLAARGQVHETVSIASLVSEYVINCYKWVIPGLLLFAGCRSRERFKWGVAALLLVYVLLGLQVIRWMPPSSAITGEDLSERSLKVLVKEVGYHRVNLAMMLAGAAWAVIAIRPALTRGVTRNLALVASITTAYALALTAGRTGYVTWMLVGLVLSVLRWRKNLLLIPIAALIIVAAVPGKLERMTQGFTEESRDTNTALGTGGGQGPDTYTITAGRSIAWPLVVEKIREAPIAGYGRLAMQRTGITAYLLQFGEGFGHPHNAYLEIWLDTGLIGFAVVIAFYGVVLVHAIKLFRDRKDPLYMAMGGVACSLVLALLVASTGSQTFYPREGSVAMWCAIGLTMRVWVERKKVMEAGQHGAIWAGAEEPVRERKREAVVGAIPELTGVAATGGRWIPPQRRKR